MTFSAGSGRSRNRQRQSRRTEPPKSTASRRSTATARTARGPATRGAAKPTNGQPRSKRSTSRKSTANHNSKTTRRPARNTARRQTATSPQRTIRSFQGKLQPMVLPSNLPSWLRSLMQIQQGVWVGTVVLSTMALGVYGWSVYSQQQWGKTYSQLQRLQRNERQLISGNEMMKNKIAQQVDPKALGLAPQKSNNVIFIKPDQTQQPTTKPAEAAAADNTPANQPLGY
ncbi:hypothetical protein IQ266_12465 [filamentous cyanobacterium LEGE 11480]|uniref:Cell division protein FtsL n=1 Tax=Romeriopsis navalis LEGE 11480 TaxID=2777977 RepID=A0A928Z3D1_9CYAN|nr:hypothetical protein [Romeriopsis navalis]MBE9030544.1 hypothetical protein [Romeriopsis navalis LEGE 11480]